MDLHGPHLSLPAATTGRAPSMLLAPLLRPTTTTTTNRTPPPPPQVDLLEHHVLPVPGGGTQRQPGAGQLA